jgi:hypothetical protein
VADNESSKQRNKKGRCIMFTRSNKAERSDRHVAFELIAQYAKAGKALVDLTKEDVQRIAKEQGTAHAAKLMAKANIPVNVARAWLVF